MNFRDNLVHMRAANNMTQEQLAMLLGVSRQSVAKWEAGKSYPEMDKLLALCQIFNCTLDELVQGDLTGKEVDRAFAASASSKPEDLFGYDALMRSFANKISNGVMAIIAGVAICAMFGALGDSTFGESHIASSNACTSIGVLALFAGVSIGLALFIPAGMSHSAFVKAHPYIEDFYTPDEKAKARSRFTSELVGGICCIFAGICVVVFLADTSYEATLGAPLMLLLVAIGVRFIVHGGLTLSRINLDNYNESAGEFLTAEEIEGSGLSDARKRQMMRSRTTDKRVGAICATIMMVATIAGLVMLFVPGFQNDLFWLAWPLGGICCGIASVLVKTFAADGD